MIAYVLGEFPSISETFILTELQGLKKHNIPLTVFALTRKRIPVTQPETSAIAKNVVWAPQTISLSRLRRLALLSKAPLKNLPAVLRARKMFYNHYFLALWLAAQIQHGGVTHIHAHFPEPSLVAMITSLLTGVPFSFTVHSHLAREKRYGLKERVFHARAVVAIGTSIRSDILSATKNSFASKIVIVRNGLDIDKHAHIKKELMKRIHVKKRQIITLLSVGRLVEHKGFAYLIKAFAKIHRSSLKTHLEIIGDGPQKETLKKLAQSLGVARAVQFTGSLPHGNAFFRKLLTSDLFVLPCITDREGNQDGLPMAILEAMLYDLPVITTDVASIPDAVDRTCGILIPEKNTEKLVRAIQQVLSASNTQKQHWGAAGSERISKLYNQKDTIPGLVRVLTS